MKIDLAALFGDAWRMFRRDREVLLPVAGLFIFLPQLALLLLVTTPPEMPTLSLDPARLQEMQQWQAQAAAWFAGNGPILIGTVLFVLFGQLAIFANYLGPVRPTLGETLGHAIRLMPRYMLLSILTGVPTGLGMQFFLLPGIFFEARLFLADVALVDEQPLPATGAFRRSLHLTRGHTLLLMALVAAVLISQILLIMPFVALRQTLDAAPIHNPVSEILIESAIAIVITFGLLLSLLLRVALYRRLTSKGI